jgi:hypothetical protein|tara:strand:+ start:7909 stop:8157 length:249 start_codon:yes stop_codon:yes gene_type:complete
MNSNYTTYTGTFQTRDGRSRKMTFIKGSDLPAGFTTGKSRRVAEGSELVYDIEYDGFRVFNWNTVEGTVTEGKVNYSFDKTS